VCVLCGEGGRGRAHLLVQVYDDEFGAKNISDALHNEGFAGTCGLCLRRLGVVVVECCEQRGDVVLGLVQRACSAKI